MGPQNNRKFNEISTTTPGPLFSQHQYNKSQLNPTYLTTPIKTLQNNQISHTPLFTLPQPVHSVQKADLHITKSPNNLKIFPRFTQLSYIKYPSGAENYTKYKKLKPKFHNVVLGLAFSTL